MASKASTLKTDKPEKYGEAVDKKPDSKGGTKDSKEKGTYEPVYSLVQDWHKSVEAKTILWDLVNHRSRKKYGFLEKPVLDGSRRLLFKRLLLVGKAGVGKTSTVNRILGLDFSTTHEETLGIQISTTYWPVKTENPTMHVTVQLELWDVGDRAMKTFGHILPSCLEATDGVIFFFSYVDRHSYDILPQMFKRVYGHHPTPEQTCFIVGTHADCSAKVVTEKEVESFQEDNEIYILPISNDNLSCRRDSKKPDGHTTLQEISTFMNAVTEILMSNDKYHIFTSEVDTGELSLLEYYLNTLPPAPSKT